MSSIDKNLSEVELPKLADAHKLKVGIVWSEWNNDITSALREGAQDALKSAGLTAENIHVLKVPGSFELPMGAKTLIAKHKVKAVICLGCVIKGETDHDKYINQAVANGLMQLSLVSSTPCTFGLLTVNSREQALDRAGGKHGNKGVEAAATALQMIAAAEKDDNRQQIGF